MQSLLFIPLGEPVINGSSSRESILLKEVDVIILSAAFFKMNISRRELASYLWPDSPIAISLNNLRTRIHRINASSAESLISKRHILSLEDTVACFDSLAFEDEIKRRLIIAAEGIGLGHPKDKEWGSKIKELMGNINYKFSVQLARVACEAIESLITRGNHENARRAAENLVQFDKNSDIFRRQLMMVNYLAGDRVAALIAFDAYDKYLNKEWGLKPDSATIDLHRAILLNKLDRNQLKINQNSEAPFYGPPGYQSAQPVVKLVERGHVFSAVKKALEQRRHVVITGSPGQGKSALVNAIIENDSTARVLCLYQEDITTPFHFVKRLMNLLDSSISSNTTGPEVQHKGLYYFPAARTRTQKSLDVDASLALYTDWLSNLKTPIIKYIVIDDLHNSDIYSIRCLTRALRNQALISAEGEAQTPSFVITTRELIEGKSLRRSIQALQCLESVDNFQLENLSPKGVSTLLSGQGYGDFEISKELTRIYDVTSGNPFAILAAIRVTPKLKDAFSRALDNPLLALVQHQLHACGINSTLLAYVACVSGKNFSFGLLENVLDWSHKEILVAWNKLQARGIFDTSGLVHQLYSTAIEEMMPLPLRKSLHGRIGNYLSAISAPMADIVWHSVRSDDFRLAFDTVDKYASLLYSDGVIHLALDIVAQALCNHSSNAKGKWWIVAKYFPLNALSRAVDPRATVSIDRLRKKVASIVDRDAELESISLFLGGWWLAEIDGQLESGFEKLRECGHYFGLHGLPGVSLVLFYCAAYSSALGRLEEAQHFINLFQKQADEVGGGPSHVLMGDELKFFGLRRSEVIYKTRAFHRKEENPNGVKNDRGRFVLGRALAEVGSHKLAINCFSKILSKDQSPDSRRNSSTDAIFYIGQSSLCLGSFSQAAAMVPRIKFAGARRVALLESLYYLYIGQVESSRAVFASAEWPVDTPGDMLLAFAKQINLLQASRIDQGGFSCDYMFSIADSLAGQKLENGDWPQRLESYIPVWLAEASPPLSNHILRPQVLLDRLYEQKRYPYFLHVALLAIEEAILSEDRAAGTRLIERCMPLLRRGRFPPFLLSPHLLHRFNLAFKKLECKVEASDANMFQRWVQRASLSLSPISLRDGFLASLDSFCDNI